MWTYSQTSGSLKDKDGKQITVGYSGFGADKNRPEDEKVVGLGPLPHGDYKILAPRDTESHGPYVMPLEPLPGTETYGREGFLFHGENKDPKKAGTASHGCIIIDRVHREQVWNSNDHLLEVVA